VNTKRIICPEDGSDVIIFVIEKEEHYIGDDKPTKMSDYSCNSKNCSIGCDIEKCFNEQT